VLKLGIVLITLGFLAGCTSPKEKALMESYQKNVDYHKQLQKTEKIQLYENNLTKLVLTATYLYKPNFEKFDQRDEEFIIGLHLEDESMVEMGDVIEIFGIRDADDIRKMRDRQKAESKVVPNSLYDDMMRFLKATDDTKLTTDKQTERVKKVTKSKVEKYGLTLKGQNAIAIKRLNKNDKRLKDIAYVTDWGSYYLVTFEHTNSKRFSLVFESEKYGKGTFSFAKVAKYIYTKKGF
jgi:hypothetical protein